MNIAFSPPDITEREIRKVAETMRSGWITTGPRTKELERKITAYTGAAGTACLNSCTAALELALRFLGVGPGDEVITSAYTYTATAAVVTHVGAKLILVDTAKDSFEMDYAKLEEAVTDKTKVVIPVDLAGRVCNYDTIFAIAERKKGLFRPANAVQALFGRLIVLADSAHGFGAERKGIRTGNIADFTAFSFHAVKNLTTGEGGALSWKRHEGLDNEAVYRALMLASLHGQSKDALAKTQAGAWEYDVLYPAYKCNMMDITAAIGLVQLERYPAMLARRKDIIGRYDRAFHPLGLRSLTHFDGEVTSSGHLYLLCLSGAGEEERNTCIRLAAEAGIACNVHYKPLPLLTAYKKLGFAIEDYPEAFAMYRSELTLPLHTKLRDEEIAYIIETMTRIFHDTILG